MYHGVTARPPAVYNWCLLDAEEFGRQVGFLVDHYQVLPLEEVVTRRERGLPLPPRAACVTFDDGFRSVATTAFPILERRGVPATVFLVTDLVGTGEPPWAERLFGAISGTTRTALLVEGRGLPLGTPGERSAAYRALVEPLKRLPQETRDERLADLLGELGAESIPPDPEFEPMDWRDVERLARSGLVQFGSHTRTHAILSRCSLERQREELAASRDALRARGLSADLFAYPNGGRLDFTEDTKGLLRDLGYRCALTTMAGLNPPGADLYELRRVGVGAKTGVRDFELGLVGL